MPPYVSTESAFSHAEDDADPGPVLFLLNALGIGGSERKTVGVVNDLHRAGWNVHLAYLDARMHLLESVSSGVPAVYLGRKGKLSFQAISALRTYIREEGINRIVCVSLYPLIYAEAACGLLSPRRRPPVILMVNATEHIGRKARMQMLLYRHLMRRAHKVIFGCRAQLELWLGRYGLDEGKCDVIYNGIDEARFAPSVRPSPAEVGFNLCDSDFVIGAVGTLRSDKNHAELIAALVHLKDRLPNARLVIVGDGPERERLDLAARSSGLSDRISLLGELADVRPILEIMNVFVLPSVSETFSNAALEAMSKEKVVILSNTGGMPEMVQDGVDGYLYERGNIGALAGLIERLASDPGTRYAIGKKARETVIERFSFARMVGEYRQLLR